MLVACPFGDDDVSACVFVLHQIPFRVSLVAGLQLDGAVRTTGQGCVVAVLALSMVVDVVEGVSVSIRSCLHQQELVRTCRNVLFTVEYAVGLVVHGKVDVTVGVVLHVL